MSTAALQRALSTLPLEDSRREARMRILEAIGLSKPRAPSVQSAGGRLVKVGPGDTLAKIALREYGDESKWEMIYQANRRTIDEPDSIYPGMELRLP